MSHARPRTLLALALIAAAALGSRARAQGSGPPHDVPQPARPAPAEPLPAPAEPPPAEPAGPAAAAQVAVETPAPAPAVPIDERVAAFLAQHDAARAAWRAASANGQAVGPHPDRAAAASAKALIDAGWSAGRPWLIANAECLWPDAAVRAREVRAVLDALVATARDGGAVEPLALALARAATDAATSHEDAARWHARARELLARAADRPSTGAALAAVGALAARTATPDDAAAVAAAMGVLELARKSYADTAGARAAACAEFAVLEREHARALAAHWRRAPDAPAAPHPTTEAWPRMRALADLGVGPARWWLVANADVGVADAEQRRALRTEQLERLVTDHANEAWLADAVRVAETLSPELGRDFVRGLGQRLLETSDHPEVRAWTLHGLAQSYARDRAAPGAEARARALLERLVAEHPGHRLARAAEPLAFELEHLRFDRVPPDFVSRDVDGREVRLAHTRGLVTIVFFWGNWSAPSVALARELVALEHRFADAPFTVLGVVTDDDADAYRRARAELGIGWVDAWQGSPGGPWPLAWGVREFPRTFVLDAHGAVRYRDLDGPALATAVRRLVREAVPGYEPRAPEPVAAARAPAEAPAPDAAEVVPAAPADEPATAGDARR